ncbi:hypothetical protein BGZ60DRAFT_415616 [Tricladium varicosporioides]|nr:hypothetical protein BGZ60DRAFT_415616 [Hymenoscyphus varicosporioides]
MKLLGNPDHESLLMSSGVWSGRIIQDHPRSSDSLSLVPREFDITRWMRFLKEFTC